MICVDRRDAWGADSSLFVPLDQMIRVLFTLFFVCLSETLNLLISFDIYGELLTYAILTQFIIQFLINKHLINFDVCSELLTDQCLIMFYIYMEFLINQHSHFLEKTFYWVWWCSEWYHQNRRYSSLHTTFNSMKWTKKGHVACESLY